MLKIEKTFIDLFSGIGAFRLGLENAGFKCIGHCEIDKYANASYMNMHEPEKEEWYADDITKVTAESVPKAGIWTAGFPCQDVSQAGKRKGLAGKRSGLFFEVMRLIQQTKEENRPHTLIFENVRGLFSSNRGLDFYTILFEMDNAGYDAEWQLINSSAYVPQNRNRIFIIGHNRKRSTRQVLPIRSTSKGTIKQLIRGGQGNRVYSPLGHSVSLKAEGGGQGAKTGLYSFVAKNKKPKVIGNVNPSGHGQNGNVYDGTKHSPTITTNKGEGIKVSLPCITPNRVKKRQNGRRIKNANEPMFTLTAQDNHGLIEYKVKSAIKKGYELATVGDSIDTAYPNSKTRRGRVGKHLSQTLTTQGNICTIDPITLAIRRLTPKECFRLQGFPDKYFHKAKFIENEITSDAQLYKMAGNSITVPVVEEIGKSLMENKIIK